MHRLKLRYFHPKGLAYACPVARLKRLVIQALDNGYELPEVIDTELEHQSNIHLWKLSFALKGDLSALGHKLCHIVDVQLSKEE